MELLNVGVQEFPIRKKAQRRYDLVSNNLREARQVALGARAEDNLTRHGSAAQSQLGTYLIERLPFGEVLLGRRRLICLRLDLLGKEALNQQGVVAAVRLNEGRHGVHLGFGQVLDDLVQRSLVHGPHYITPAPPAALE